ncbi:MAG: hypothetical protein ACYCSB_02035 [bacterium]
MKKILLIFSFLFFGLILTGCAKQTPAQIVSKSYIEPDSLVVFMGLCEKHPKEFNKVFNYCSSHSNISFWEEKNCDTVYLVHEEQKQNMCPKS